MKSQSLKKGNGKKLARKNKAVSWSSHYQLANSSEIVTPYNLIDMLNKTTNLQDHSHCGFLLRCSVVWKEKNKISHSFIFNFERVAWSYSMFFLSDVTFCRHLSFKTCTLFNWVNQMSYVTVFFIMAHE